MKKPCSTDHAYRCTVCGTAKPKRVNLTDVDRLADAAARVDKSIQSLNARIEIYMSARGVGKDTIDRVRDDVQNIAMRAQLLTQEVKQVGDNYARFIELGQTVKLKVGPVSSTPVECDEEIAKHVPGMQAAYVALATGNPGANMDKAEDSGLVHPAEVSRAIAKATGHSLPLDLATPMEQRPDETNADQIP